MKKPDILENPEILQTLKKEVKKHGEAECTIGSISVVLRKVTLIGGKAYYFPRILSNQSILIYVMQSI